MASSAQPNDKAAGRAASEQAQGDDQPQIKVPSPLLLVTGVMLASTMQVLDTTIANVALPHMQASLGAALDTVTWVLTSYIVASAIALPLTGWLAERIGRRELLVISVGGFIVASMACGLAANLPEMVLFRIAQGIFGAFMVPVGQAVMLDATPPSRHAKMLALWGAAFTIGPILGPVLGGWLTANANWRWCFFINAPIGALSLFLIVTNLPKLPRRKSKFDLTGFLLIGIAIGSLQLLLDRGQHVDWFESKEVWIYATLTASLGWAAIYHMAVSRNPLIPRALFADRNLLVANFLIVVMSVTMYSVMALLAPMMQNLFGYGAYSAGVAIASRGVGTIIAMQVSQYFVRIGVSIRIIVASGLLLAAYSLLRMSGWSLEVDRYEFMLIGVIQGLGLGMILIPLNILAFTTLKPELRTDASSMLNLTRSLGGSLGIAFSTLIMSRYIQINHAELAERLSADKFGPINPATAQRMGDYGEAALRIVDAEVSRQAAMIAYTNNFYMIGIMCLLSLPMIFLIKTQKPPD